MKECKLGAILEAIYELFDECDFDAYELPYNEISNITVEGFRMIIPQLELSLRYGDVCICDEEEDYYESNFSVTLIYEEQETLPEKYLHLEQDEPLIALYNFLRDKGITMEELEEYDCVIELDKIME